MKRNGFFTSGLVAGAVAFVTATSLQAQSTEQGVIKVVNVHGPARYFVSGDPNPHPLKSGALLKPGTIIQTAEHSYVDVVLNNPNATTAAAAPDNSGGGGASSMMNASHANRHPKVEQDSIRIFENSALGFDKMTVTHTGAEKATETQLDLKRGRIFGTVKKLNAASKYEIKIPNGVAAIRGTVFLLSADGHLDVMSSLADAMKNVPSGSVVLAYFAPDGNVITQVVSDGQSFNTQSGQLSPMSESTMSEMLNLASLQGIALGGFFVQFSRDATVYFVSPTMAGN